MQKVSLPKGTRDFTPDMMAKRNYILDIIKTSFVRYGFRQIETPAMENIGTLTGKYGDEGDKLLFRVLNSGNFMKDVDSSITSEIVNRISEKGLRYDLTVPLARFVAMNRDRLVFPFKRYQIQNVWRADRPQKGRYREFLQCDADIVGSVSLLNEAELIRLADEVFSTLKMDVVFKINNRKILAGIAEYVGYSGALTDITVAIDKLDKVGVEKVNEGLRDNGLSESSISKLQQILFMEGGNREKLETLKGLLGNEVGRLGISEVEKVLDYLDIVGLKMDVVLDFSLARGLDYYTGCIFEAKVTDFEIGSVLGGGRYDNLTSVFGLENVSGVGLSFGIDRIYDVLDGLNLFPDTLSNSTEVLFLNLGDEEAKYCLTYVKELRDIGINTELYPDTIKIQKQLAYADNYNIPYVVIVGENEMKEGVIKVKSMKTGNQINVYPELLSTCFNNINNGLGLF
jgi:histidyl-tRNA synthetase